jgi:F-type H+-transporting ATPase subunit delta
LAAAHRVYAEALLAASKEADVLERVRDEFDDFTAALEASPELRGFLRNPQIERATKREVLEDLLEGADVLLLNFLRILVEKGRAAEVDGVRREWERLLAREEHVLELELTTAVELSDEEASEIVKEIEKATGRRVDASRRVERDLIGGLVVQAGSVRLDGTVRGRLTQLREDLMTRS